LAQDHQQQQRQKSDKPGAEGGSVALKAAPEQSPMGALEALPGLSFDTLNTLQRSIGNAAIGRLVSAGNAATAEVPTPVSRETQDAIDSQRSGGQAMAGGVRVHTGPPADTLTRSLHANAFTQGRDVFLGANAGQETLAHEMAHVSQGAPASGAVMREPAAQTPAAPGPVPLPYPNTGGSPDAAQSAPAAQGQAPPGPEEKRYKLEFEVPHLFQTAPETLSYPDQSEEEAIETLYKFRQKMLDIIDNHKVMHRMLRDNREEHNIVGFWADTFGGVDLPDMEMWTTAQDTLFQSRLMLDGAKEGRKDTAVAQKWWAEQIASGTWRGAYDPTADRIQQAATFMQAAATQMGESIARLIEYKDGTEAGAATGITVCKVSIVVLSSAAGGSAFAAARTAGFGLMSSAAFASGVGVVTTTAEGVGTQIGEMRYGEREWGDFDFKKLGKAALKSAVVGFVGAVTGGKLTELVGAGFARYAAPYLADMGINLNSAGAKFLGEMGANWLTTAGSSPFTTSAGLVMDTAMGDPTGVKGWGDYFNLVMHNMKDELVLGTFLHMAGTAAQGMSGGHTTTQAGDGPTSSGVPEYVGPEGDASLSPDVSTGVPEPIGPGYEPTQPQGDTATPAVTGTEPTEPVSGPHDGVPEHVGPEDDAPLSPDVSTGVPEPVGPGYEPTQPQGNNTQPTVTGTEPTEPVSRPNNGVPEHVGPEGDAYYSPDAAKNQANGPSPEVQNGNGGGGPGGGENGGGPGRRDTLPGMGAAGPAGENAPPRITTPMAAQQQPARRFSETSEPTESFSRAPENRMTVSGFSGSLPEGYGVFRTRVRLASGEVVDAAVKIYPGEMASQFAKEVAGAQAAAATGMGPEFYGQVSVPIDAQYARPRTNDLAFAMEPIEGAFARHGTEPGDPGHAQAVAESEAAASRIGDNTIEDVHDFASAILNQGYYYGGSHGGEVQGLIGPGGEWRPIDFQGLNPLPSPQDAAAYQDAISEHERWVNDEVDNLQRARDDFVDEDPTQH
jgi:hypothetical protein